MTDDSPRALLRRRNTTMGLLLAGAAVLLVGGLTAGIWTASSGPDRSDPRAVTTAFVERYAAGDPDACEFATPDLAAHLGGCTGASGPSPQVDVAFAQTCGNQSLTGVTVNPPGAVGKRHALVGLLRTDEGFTARSIQPLSTLAGQQPGECTSGTRHGG